MGQTSSVKYKICFKYFNNANGYCSKTKYIYIYIFYKNKTIFFKIVDYQLKLCSLYNIKMSFFNYFVETKSDENYTYCFFCLIALGLRNKVTEALFFFFENKKKLKKLDLIICLTTQSQWPPHGDDDFVIIIPNDKRLCNFLQTTDMAATVTAVTMKLDGNMNVMSRSNTWPVVVVRLDHDGGGHMAENGPSHDGPCTAVTDDQTGGGVAGINAGMADTCPLAPLSARKRATLQRHYYPEGGWGWVIVATAVAVHVLNHGFQLSAAVTLKSATDRHGQTTVNAGERPRLWIIEKNSILVYLSKCVWNICSINVLVQFDTMTQNSINSKKLLVLITKLKKKCICGIDLIP